MAARNHRREIEKALDRAKARYSFRFPAAKSGTLVVDLEAAASNLALVQRTLADLPAPWPKFAAWLANPHRAAEHRDGNILLTTAFTATAAGASVTDEAALLAAIVDAPDDDAPRLVYADLLVSRGDPRGELIVAQCRLARREGSVDDLDRLEKRVAALLASGWKAYAGELAPYTDERAFQRGFVHAVRMSFAAFVRQGERVFGAWPTHTLDLFNGPSTTKDVEKLARLPSLARVRALAMGHGDGPPAELAALGASSYVAHLERFELRGHGASAKDWSQLFARIDAPVLATIELHAAVAAMEIPAAIAANPKLRTLRRFESRRPQTRGARNAATRTREAYAELARRVQLHHLFVDGDALVDDDALAAFFEPDAAAELRSLNLDRTGATDRLLRTMAHSAATATLEDLELDGSFTVAGVTELVRSSHAARLRRLAITNYDWTDDAIAELDRVLLDLPPAHPLRVVRLPGRADGSAALQARYAVD